MNVKNLLFILLCCGMFCNAQNFYELQNVSKAYNVIANIENCSEKSCTGKSTIDLYDRTNMKKYQTLYSDNFYLQLNENKKPIVDSLKNSIVFEDFNFDGNEDVAIVDGINNKNRVFKVYLKNDSTQPFVLNESLTNFVLENSLLFKTDPESKRIITYLKKACCWSLKSEYIFTPEQRLVKVYEFEEDTKDSKKVITVEREFKNYKWSAKTKIYPKEQYFKEGKNENTERD
jgi:hypothetical protein